MIASTTTLAARTSGPLLGLMLALALAAPASGGPPFLSDDPDPTPRGEYEIYLFADAARTQAGHGGDFGVDFNYGASPDLQLTATAPIGFGHPRNGGAESGLGNIELAAKLRFLHQETFGWDVAVFPRVFLPAGSDLGEDHASLLIPIWIGREWDGWSTFGGGGCAINRGGDSKDYCIAGWALTRRVLPNLQIGGELYHETPDAEGGHASTVLGLGATYDLGETLHLLGYLGAGLENAAETGREVGYASVLFTF